jgi:hypothetical protein
MSGCSARVPPWDGELLSGSAEGNRAFMDENVYEDASLCPNGGHDFEALAVAGGMGIVLGESRCRICGALAADEVMVDGKAHSDRRTGHSRSRACRAQRRTSAGGTGQLCNPLGD